MKTKKRLFLCLCVIFLCGLVFVLSGCEMYATALSSSFKTKTVEGGVAISGLTDEAKAKESLSLEIPNIIGSKPVIEILDYAFFGCENILSISIPDSVKKIGSYAFSDCTRLTEVSVGKNVTSVGTEAFYSCPISRAKIPSSLASHISKESLQSVTVFGGDLEDWAFAYSKNLKSVSVGDGVTSIGSKAFYDCTRLNTIELSPHVEYIDYDAFYSCPVEHATLPIELLVHIDKKWLKTATVNNGEEIYAGAFADCKHLTKVNIKASVTSINNNAFNACVALREITLPESLVTIGDKVFKNCSVLKEIKLPKNLKSIGSSAFEYCSELSAIYVPLSVESMGYFAFFNCPSLTIYCEAKETPDKWAKEWNSDNLPVVWDYLNQKSSKDTSASTQK